MYCNISCKDLQIPLQTSNVIQSENNSIKTTWEELTAPQELLIPATFVELENIHFIVENTLHWLLVFFLLKTFYITAVRWTSLAKWQSIIRQSHNILLTLWLMLNLNSINSVSEWQSARAVIQSRLAEEFVIVVNNLVTQCNNVKARFLVQSTGFD